MGKQKVFLTFHKELYVGDGVKHVTRVKWKLVHRAGMIGIYVICVCQGLDELEIMHAGLLKQPYYRDHPPLVVGIASGYDEAVSLIQRIVSDVFEKTGDYRLKDYFLKDACGNKA